MLHDHIRKYYGEDCQLLAVERTGRQGTFLFVADATRRGRLLRTLGTVGRSGAILEQSAMDLLHPERLVFAYERLMFLAFALAPKPEAALLLGLGGGAMLRHLDAYLPDCLTTIVERDRAVIDLARRYFHLARPVVAAEAEDIAADCAGAFDVVLVDLYDAQGAVSVPREFWLDCVACLKPGGCLAINWAGFLEKREVQAEISGVAGAIAPSFFVTDRSPRPNMVQLAPTDPDFRLAELEARLRDFARRHKLPAEDRNVLQRCAVSARNSSEGR
jgi:spermidine synthase